MTGQGRFGRYGGRYVPETLIPALEELEVTYEAASRDEAFQTELDHLLRRYCGRPTPLYFAGRLTAFDCDGPWRPCGRYAGSYQGRSHDT